MFLDGPGVIFSVALANYRRSAPAMLKAAEADHNLQDVVDTLRRRNATMFDVSPWVFIFTVVVAACSDPSF